VDVKLQIGAEGRVSASMSFENPQAAADLRGRVEELKSALEQAGFKLSDNALSFDVAGQNAGQNARQNAQEGQQRPSSAWNGQAFQAAMNADDLSPANLVAPWRAARASGVDVRI
jgi:flagellar hook-length control protein FliK